MWMEEEGKKSGPRFRLACAQCGLMTRTDHNDIRECKLTIHFIASNTKQSQRRSIRAIPNEFLLGKNNYFVRNSNAFNYFPCFSNVSDVYLAI